MTKREKIIKGLECCASTEDKPACYKCPYYDPKLLTIECKCARIILRDCIKLITEKDWVKVSEKLPKNDEEVFVCTISKKGIRNVDKGYYFVDRWIHRGTAEVTHWKPITLPED